jgi:hypothetical protein
MHNLAAMIPDPSDESTRDRRPLRVFFSYAAEDDAYRIQLEKHLRMLQRDGLIETWHDRKILPGTAWGSAIDAQLEAADIVLLLVSADFLNSDYCVDIEMTRALERHDAQQAQVVPVIVRHCDWSTARFAKLQALPDRARPVEAWTVHAFALMQSLWCGRHWALSLLSRRPVDIFWWGPALQQNFESFSGLPSREHGKSGNSRNSGAI